MPFFALAALLIFSPAVSAAPVAKVGSGKEVTLAYKLFVGGTLLETADAKNPFTYTHGQNQIVPGLEKGLAGLQVGDQKTIRVVPKEA
jgi:FKBP-type peptidyl-prolyl cis-trans isomerase 2